MRELTLAAAAILLCCTVAAEATDLRWPDPEIPVPQKVETFIRFECAMHHRQGSEALSQCRQSERFAYRATVMMLLDDEIGERSAERYLICRGGLGIEGGRFHRRRADCIGKAQNISWQYEFSRKASGSAVLQTRRAEMGAVESPVRVLALRALLDPSIELRN